MAGHESGREIRAEDLRGHLDALVLACLESGPQHGYAISDHLSRGSQDHLKVPTGTLYPALHRLERAGWVESQWSTAAGRRRRTYQLTAAGRRALEQERARWDQLSRIVVGLLHPAREA